MNSYRRLRVFQGERSGVVDAVLIFCLVCRSSEDVELILKGIDGCHGSDSQDNDQPDYDSVASDEDPDREVASRDNGNDRRTKVCTFL